MKTRWIIFVFVVCSAAAIAFALHQNATPRQAENAAPEKPVERVQAQTKFQKEYESQQPKRTIASIDEPSLKNTKPQGGTFLSSELKTRLLVLSRAELDHIYPGAEMLESPEIAEIDSSEESSNSKTEDRFTRNVLVRGDKDFPAIAAKQWLDANGNVTREALVVANEVLVKLRKGKTLSDLASVAQVHQLNVETGIQDNGLVVLRFKNQGPSDVDRKITAVLRESDIIERAIPNGIVKAK